MPRYLPLFFLPTASAALDKMGKVVAPSPVFKMNKMVGAFTADTSAHVALGPANLGRPFFISKLPASLCQ